jgi:signal transduction histidine kinase
VTTPTARVADAASALRAPIRLRRRIALVSVLLALLIVAAVAWTQSGGQRQAALEAQARSHLGLLRGALVEAAASWDTASQDLADRLAAVARRAATEVASARLPAAEVLAQVAREERVGRIAWFSPDGEQVALVRHPARVVATGTVGTTSDALEEEDLARLAARLPHVPGSRLDDGVRSNVFGTRQHLGIAWRTAQGSAVLVRADAAALAALRERFGLGTWLDRLATAPDVRLVALGEPGGRRLAARGVEAAGGADPAVGVLVRRALIEVEGLPPVEAEVHLDRTALDDAVAAGRRATALGALWAALVVVLAAAWAARREAAEQQREAARAAARAEDRRMTELGALGALLAHEVSNPLNGIRLGVQVLRQRMDEGAHEDLLASIEGEVRRAGERVEGFLGLARHPAAAAEGVGADVLPEIAEAARGQALRLGVALDVVAGDEGHVLAPRVVLEQAVLNLVRNALEATPRGGRVVLRWARTGEGQVRVSVEDGGTGFPADVLDGSREGTSKAGGHGLGLALARRFAATLGGRLELGAGPAGGGLACIIWPAQGQPAP